MGIFNGISCTVLIYGLDQLGVHIPRWLALTLIALAVLVPVVVALVGRPRSEARSASNPTAIHSRNVNAAPLAGARFNNSTVNLGDNRADRVSTVPDISRAIAVLQAEIIGISAHLSEAVRQGHHVRRYGLPQAELRQCVGWLHTHGQGDLSQRLSSLQARLEVLNTRLDGRRWEPGPMPELRNSPVSPDDDTAGLIGQLGELGSALSAVDTALPVPEGMRRTTYNDIERRFASYGDLEASGHTYKSLAQTLVPLSQDIGAELVAIIDEMPLNIFAEPDNVTFEDWLKRTANFIEATLGPVERQRFRGGVDARDRNDCLKVYHQRLQDLLNRLDSIPVQVEAGKVREAIEIRRSSKSPLALDLGSRDPE